MRDGVKIKLENQRQKIGITDTKILKVIIARLLIY